MKAFRNVNLNLPGAMVSLPVSISKATGDGNGALKSKVVGPKGEVLRQVYLNPDGDEVDRDSTKREIEGRVFTQDELKAIDAQCKLTDLDILEVCPKDAVNSLRVSGAYYIYANKKVGNARSFNMFVQALKEMKSVAVVKWTPSSRQQLLVLRPEGEALVGQAVVFAEDWREADEDVLSHVGEKATKREVELAVQLLESVKGEGKSLEEQTDEAIQLKKDLIAGTAEAPVQAETEPTKGEDLAAQLEASMEALKAEKQKVA